MAKRKSTTKGRRGRPPPSKPSAHIKLNIPPDIKPWVKILCAHEQDRRNEDMRKWFELKDSGLPDGYKTFDPERTAAMMLRNNGEPPIFDPEFHKGNLEWTEREGFPGSISFAIPLEPRFAARMMTHASLDQDGLQDWDPESEEAKDLIALAEHGFIIAALPTSLSWNRFQADLKKLYYGLISKLTSSAPRPKLGNGEASKTVDDSRGCLAGLLALQDVEERLGATPESIRKLIALKDPEARAFGIEEFAEVADEIVVTSPWFSGKAYNRRDRFEYTVKKCGALFRVWPRTYPKSIIEVVRDHRKSDDYHAGRLTEEMIANSPEEPRVHDIPAAGKA